MAALTVKLEIINSDFKSIYPNIQDNETIKKYMDDAVIRQDTLQKITTPWEKRNNDEIMLQKFTVNIKDIDRLYYINKN